MNNIYLYIFILILFACWILIFFRSLTRKKLLRKVRSYFVENNLLDDNSKSTKSTIFFRQFFFDIECLRLLRKEINNMPDSYKKSYKQYKVLNYLTYFSIFIVILYAINAHKFFN